MHKLAMTLGLLLLSVSATTPAEESSPYVLLNFNYDSVNFTNWNEPENRHWSWWNLEKLMPFPVEIGRGTLPVHEFGKRPMDLSGITATFEGREINLADYFDQARVDGFLVIKDNDIVYEAYPRQMRQQSRAAATEGSPNQDQCDRTRHA